MNIFLYFATVFIWGSTWLGIHYQLGNVDPAASLFYRFMIAALIMVFVSLFRRENLVYTARQNVLFASQGVFLFSLNYWFIYQGTTVLDSGLVALLFSTIAIMNIINGKFFLRKQIDFVSLLGAVIGLIGIGVVFIPGINKLSNIHELGAVALCLIGTYLSSLGNIMSGINQSKGVSVIASNTFSMIYAALLLGVFCVAKGTQFNFDYSFTYIGSLFYLAIFGSVLAFYFYLTLLGRIGADRAVYAMLVFPLVALILSSVFEGLNLSPNIVIGFSIVMAGNFLILLKPINVDALYSRLMRCKKTDSHEA